MTNKKKIIINVVIIVSILVISVAVLLGVNLGREDGAGVVVRVDGKEVASYSLAIDGTYKLNGGTNTLCIKDGKAWLIYATCPDKLCVKQGKISKTGQTITCLPNKLTITVKGADDFVELG